MSILVFRLGFDRRSQFWWDSCGPVDFYPVIQFSAALLSFCQTDCQPASSSPERGDAALYYSGQKKENKYPIFSLQELCSLV